MKQTQEITATEAAEMLGIELKTFLARVRAGKYKWKNIKFGKKIYDAAEIKATPFIDKRLKK